MFSNKGDFSDLKNIILIIFVAVILLLIMPIIIKGGSKGSDIASCRNWVVLQSAIKDPALGIKLKDLKNPCTTFEDELKDKKDDYEVLAKGMHDTWKMYGQGKIDFFSDWDWGIKNTYCFVGDEIKIDEDRTINIGKFEEYLSNTNVPKSEITYAEFFTGTENTNLDFGSENIELKKGEKLYIMFIVKKAGIWGPGKFVKIDILGCTVGGAIGGTIGTATIPIPLIGTLIGAGKGCIWGMVISEGIHLTTIPGQAEELYPGLILVSSKDTKSLEKECDEEVYYNPK